MSRERRSQIFETNKDIPPVGFYRPKYKIIDKNKSNVSFDIAGNSLKSKNISIDSPTKKGKEFNSGSTQRYEKIINRESTRNNFDKISK